VFFRKLLDRSWRCQAMLLGPAVLAAQPGFEQNDLAQLRFVARQALH
jgi:hypothetical protein